MMLFGRKYLQAAAALAVVIAASFAVFFPIVAAFNTGAAKSGALRVFQDRIDLLEDRLESERQAFAVELADGNPMVRSYILRDAAGAAPGPPESLCARLTDGLASRGIAIASPCRLSQSPLGDDRILHSAEITAQGEPSAILTAADDPALGQAMLHVFRLSLDDISSKNSASTLQLQLIDIAPAGAREE